ncbi:caspase family protein [Lewinella cohaerens]|uniref:nSTAND1 domain-containing NTPase n=1 Tax=Lewinella cohaerens TaxID=70995 RepID=UPI00037E2244|nr:caspase family protein [Lewinella cohaerens]
MSTENNNIQLPFTTSHAFIIGINDYEHLTPLSTAVNDAQVLAERLAEDHGYQVHPPLLNANRAAIMQLLEVDLPRLVSEDDRILFYFAGHGIALDSDDAPKGYLVPADAKPGDPETLLAMDTFHDAVTKLPCKHGLLVLDCCFAGAFKWSTGFRDVMFDLPGIIYQERFHQYTQDPAWQVITSSASDQKAVDILSDRTLGMRSAADAKHSPFATALLAGLAGEADTVPKEKGDGVITATELYTYLRDRVEDETTEEGKRQSPAMFSLQRHDKGQYIFLHPRHVLNLPPIPDRNPFMGLKSYNETDSNLFYGRDRVIVALADLAAEQSLIVVSGASGTGKSSVIKAGLLPSLRKNDWHILPVIRPGKSPLESLQSGLPDLDAALKKEGKSVLIIDQYEELITQCLDPQERLDFEAQLADWLKAYPQLRIVLSIRSDFEPQFEEGALANWWQKGRYVVPVFSQDELREVIIKPTVQEVLFFESDILVDKLLEAVNQAPGALPLLSFTLSELYHAYLKSGRTNRAFALEDYEKLGGVIGALRTRANAIYDDLDQAHQDSMRKLMLRMVSLEGGELASRRVASSDLVFSDPAESERLQNVAQQLVTARLISTGVDTQGQTFFEPAHDALVRAWARLWEWIKAQGEGRLGLMYKLSLAVTDYEINQKNEYLWNDDPRLDLLLADLQIKGHVFNAKEETFLQKSNALRQKNKRRRAGVIAAVMIGLLGLAAFAFYEQGIAKDAQLQASQEAKNALLAQKNAERSDSIAQQEAKAAKEALLKAEVSDSLARRSAVIAGQERDNALWQTKLARQAQSRAEQSTIEAKSATAAAKAQKEMSEDPTLALNLALAAHKLFPSEETSSALRDIHRRRRGQYYRHKFSAHQNIVNGITYSPDGTKILTAGKDSVARLWKLNGQLIREFPRQNSEITRALFSPSGDTILTGMYDGHIALWHLNGEQILRFRAHPAALSEVAYSPDGSKIVTNSYQEQAKLWSLEGQNIRDFGGGRGPVTFSPDGKNVLTTGDGWQRDHLLLWDIASGASTDVPTAGQTIYTFGFSPDGAYVVAGGEDKTISITNLATGQVYDHQSDTDKMRSLTFSPDGKKIITRSDTDGNSKVWQLPDREVWMNNDTAPWTTLWQTNVDSNSVMAVCFSPDSKQFLTGEEDGTVHIWDIEESLPSFEHNAAITGALFFPNGDKIITAEGNPYASERGKPSLISGIFPFQNVRQSMGQGFTGTPTENVAKIWDSSGRYLLNFQGHQSWINSTSISLDGETLLTGSNDGTAKAWDSSGSVLQTFTAHGDVLGVDISPDGKLVLTSGADSTAKLWRISGEELKTFTEHTALVSCVDFAPDGRIFVTGSHDNTAKIWRQTGEKITDLRGHRGKIADVCFSPNGKLVLTASYDGTAKLWNTSGEHLMTFPENERKEMLSVAFSPDGKTLLTGSQEFVRLWDLSGRLLRLYRNLGGQSVDFSPNGQIILISKENKATLVRNIFGQYTAGTLWNDVYKLTPAEQAEYGIDWEY